MGSKMPLLQERVEEVWKTDESPRIPFKEGLSWLWEVWSAESLYLSALGGSAPVAESHSPRVACIWCLSEIRYDCLAISVHCKTHWQTALVLPLPHSHPGPLQGWGGFSRPAVPFDFLCPILLPPFSFHRCLSLINILHPKLSLCVCF